MRILITGASGLLGGRLGLLLSGNHEVTGLVRSRPAPDGIASLAADLSDVAALGDVLDSAQPEAVVHCAALADAEICEREPERARRENASVTRHLASQCRARGARLISISTDLVFDGLQAFAREDSPARPLTEYGRTKLAAEAATLDGATDSVVLRVALVSGRGYGPRLSATESVAQRLRRGEPVTLYEDEWRTPVDAESVAEAIRAVLLRPQVNGRFHVAGAERVSRVDIGQRTARAFGLDEQLVRRAPQRSHQGAPRPADVSLDITRARKELGWAPRPLDEAIREGRLL